MRKSKKQRQSDLTKSPSISGTVLVKRNEQLEKVLKEKEQADLENERERLLKLEGHKKPEVAKANTDLFVVSASSTVSTSAAAAVRKYDKIKAEAGKKAKEEVSKLLEKDAKKQLSREARRKKRREARRAARKVRRARREELKTYELQERLASLPNSALIPADTKAHFSHNLHGLQRSPIFDCGQKEKSVIQSPKEDIKLKCHSDTETYKYKAPRKDIKLTRTLSLRKI